MKYYFKNILNKEPDNMQMEKEITVLVKTDYETLKKELEKK